MKRCANMVFQLTKRSVFTLRLFITFLHKKNYQLNEKLLLQIVVIICLTPPYSVAQVNTDEQVPRIKTNVSDTIPNIKFRNIEHERLSEIFQIWSINEDNQGFIWITGARGAVRYDGVNFKLFQYNAMDPYSLPEGYVVDFQQTPDNQMWFGTYKGLFKFDPNTERFTKIDLTTKDGVSLNIIRDLLLMPDGSLLIGQYGIGIGQYFPDSHKFILHDQVNSTLVEGALPNSYALLLDREGYVWVGSESNLTRFNLADKSTTVYRHNNEDTDSILPGPIMSLAEDTNGYIWIGTSEGASKFDKKNNRFINYINEPHNPYSLSGKNISDIEIDKDGQIWCISDGGGISLYNPETNHFFPFKANREVSGSIKSNSVRRAFISKTGDMWLGYHPYGIAVSNRYAKAFKTFDRKDEIGPINAVSQVKPNELWIGSELGVHHINLTTDNVTHYKHAPGIKNSLSSNAVISLLMDSSNRLWVGTWGGGLNRIDIDNNQFTHFTHEETNINSLPSNRVWTILERDINTLWVGTERGLSIYDIEQNKFTPVDEFNIRIGKMMYYTKDTLLILDDDKLQALNTTTMKVLELSKKWDALPGIINFHTNDQGEIWLNTENGFRYQKNIDSEIKDFSEDGEIATQYYSQIVTDNQGSVWLGNSHGITRYNPLSHQYTLYRSEHGLPSDVFRGPRATKILSDGKVAMGGTDGLVVFDPSRVYREERPAIPILINLKVLDRFVDLDANDSPLDKVINLARQINLNYEQNVFSIEYTALEYQLPTKNQFSFRLKGFDNDWRFVDKQRIATYTNLDPGRYIFELKAANDQGAWSDEITSININVEPPWFKTWWAYSLYLSGLAFVISLIAYGIWSQHQREQERKVSNKLKEIDGIKDEFMAKTSHELRTPLNGIIGLTEAIINGSTGNIPQETKDKLKVVVSSGKRLANIINDILDFSKLREHEISLNFSEVGTYDLVSAILTLSEPLLGGKDIELINKIPKTITPIHADEQRLNQIFFNLIGNAIKFTESGSITIKAVERGTNIIFSIIDTGMGIKAEDQENIFKPFEQSTSESSVSHVGTGLGLTVTKQLIELHKGEIYVESRQGEGSTFSFSIPVCSNSSTIDSISNIRPEQSQNISPAIEHSAKKRRRNKILNKDKERPRILVVDDEAVNRMVLEAYLGQVHFDIVECANGRQALDNIKNEPPFNLVLLDVMMPDMSGYDVCEEIRKTHTLVELPVIFLTAKAQVDDMSRGYKAGANDFLYKPVVREEFLAKIQIHLQTYAAYQRAIKNTPYPPKS